MAAISALLVAQVFAFGGAGHAASSTKIQHLHYRGTFAPGSVKEAGTAGSGQIPPHMPNSKTIRHTQAAGVPSVQDNGLSGSQLPGFAGFNGISHFDQATAGTGIYAGTQFELEPPDQGLCVGGGKVVEAVNNAMRVFDTAGDALTAPVALNQFFMLKPEFQPGPPPLFGDFISDPKCDYDPDTGHWFLTELQISLDPSTGAFVAPTHQLVAVSTTSDPTGDFNIYELDTTNDGSDGTPTDAGCPCFGDQPLIGADANGFYVTTNEYTLSTFAFNGAQVYAFSKTGLETGTNTNAVRIFAGPMTLSLPNGGLAFSIQPATSPNSGYETANNGTEFFMSATDWGAAPALGTRADRVLTWALTNTASLNTASPSVALSFVAVNSELYAQPPNAQQAPGPTPLGDSVHNPLELLAANDDRLNQTVFAAGNLWAGLNTSVKLPTGATMVGTAWFIVAPSDGGGTLSATMTNQGYAAVTGANLLYPSIGVTASGAAVIAFSIVGPSMHPSAAYAPLSMSDGAGAVRIAAVGAVPDDGFTGYRAFGGVGVGRWGDYSAAVADPSGNIWMATEYIANQPRTTFANWGTFVYHVTP
jgi:hypothetical protein